MYVVTRQDLSLGDQACQAVHAAFDFSVRYPEITGQWNRDSNYLVLLSAENEEALLELQRRANVAGLRSLMCREPDLNDEATALVIEPGETTSRLCSNLPLALRADREAVLV